MPIIRINVAFSIPTSADANNFLCNSIIHTDDNENDKGQNREREKWKDMMDTD